MKLRFVEHPLYKDAHPDDEGLPISADCRCMECAIAECVETGRRFLLWMSNGVHWALSRHDPHYDSDLRVEVEDFNGPIY